MFMFPDEQTPPLDKATVDHIVNTALNYAKQQYESALKARSSVLVKIRLSRAIGALDAIKIFIGVNPEWDVYRTQCDDVWKNAQDADYDPDDAWLYGDIHDLLDF